MKRWARLGVLLVGAVAAAAAINHHLSRPTVRPAVASPGSAGAEAPEPAPPRPDPYVHVDGSAMRSQASPEAEYNPVDAKMKVEDRLVLLDDRLRAEPLSPDWAAQRSEDIRQALSTEKLEEFNAKAPRALEISCRSTGCRISMDFDDPITAPDTVTALTVGIASSFPEVVIVPISGEHGVQYHVFAAAQRGSPLFARDRKG